MTDLAQFLKDLGPVGLALLTLCALFGLAFVALLAFVLFGSSSTPYDRLLGLVQAVWASHASS